MTRGNGSNIQTVTATMNRYAASGDKNINKLMRYAELLRIKPKNLRYIYGGLVKIIKNPMQL